MGRALFKPEVVTVTAEANQLVIDTATNLRDLIAMHATGDWGLYTGTDAARYNDKEIAALRNGDKNEDEIAVVSKFKVWGGLRNTRGYLILATTGNHTKIDVARLAPKLPGW